MFCREASSSLQTLKIAKNIGSLFPKPSPFTNSISPGRGDKLCRHPNRCKVTASSQSNVDQKSKLSAKKIKVKGYITAQEALLEGLGWSRPLDDISDLCGRSLLVELISSQTDSSSPSSTLSLHMSSVIVRRLII